jgi:hypothetical protein
MSRLRPFLAVLLLAAWLPATLHCALEAAGCTRAEDCCDGHADGGCTRDSCDTLEAGFLKPAALHVALPQFSADAAASLLDSLCPPLRAPAARLLPPVTGVTAAVAAPPEVARTWRFAVRAAPAPRAPSLAS